MAKQKQRKKKLALPPIKQVSKKEPVKRISFLERRKTDQDKFRDITEKFKKDAFLIKDDELYFSKRRFDNIISKELKLSKAQIKRMQEGNTNKKDKARLKKLHRKYPKTTKKSKNFKRDQIPSKWKYKKIRPLKRDEVYHLRAGLLLVFRSDTSNTEIMYEGVLTRIWTIPNYTVSIDSDLPIGKATEFFLSFIKSKLETYDSLLYFAFNYFDVSIVSTSTKVMGKDDRKK